MHNNGKECSLEKKHAGGDEPKHATSSGLRARYLKVETGRQHKREVKGGRGGLKVKNSPVETGLTGPVATALLPPGRIIQAKNYEFQ